MGRTACEPFGDGRDNVTDRYAVWRNRYHERAQDTGSACDGDGYREIAQPQGSLIGRVYRPRFAEAEGDEDG